MDVNAYSNHIKTVTLSGKDYKLRGLGIAELLSEGANHIRDQHIGKAKVIADKMDLQGGDRVDFLMRWLGENPEPAGSKLEDMVLDYVASPSGVLQITAFGLARQAEIGIEDAKDIITESNYDNMIAAAQVLFGGIIKLGGTTAAKKQKRRRP
jgi:hypothetical protein